MAEEMHEPLSKIVAKVESLAEFNPMLGHRGCRLGNTYPEITEMQTRAIIEAAMNVKAAGVPVHVEIMVPLVGNHKELRYQKNIIDRTAEQVFSERNDKIEYMVGTMIEVPRAAVTANQIAEVAQFFSFGTNDLTQMTLGFSRDDISKFLPVYLEKGILKNDPFQILDRNGVGQLIREAVFKGRGTRENLKCGICGEHGGEPSSVEFCHYAGLNYVSCSPFRVPIARLAAAHAALNQKQFPEGASAKGTVSARYPPPGLHGRAVLFYGRRTWNRTLFDGPGLVFNRVSFGPRTAVSKPDNVSGQGTKYDYNS